MNSKWHSLDKTFLKFWFPPFGALRIKWIYNVSLPGPEVIELYSCSIEHEILDAHKYKTSGHFKRAESWTDARRPVPRLWIRSAEERGERRYENGNTTTTSRIINFIWNDHEYGFCLSYDPLNFKCKIISIRNALLTRTLSMTLRNSAKVLLHVWSYDRYLLNNRDAIW